MKIKDIKIDKNLCIGCGNCELLAPRAFKIEDGKSVLRKDWRNEKEDSIRAAVASCPMLAITIAEED